MAGLVRIAGATAAPVVAVVVAGRPHVLTDVLARSAATLWAGYAGPYGPEAVVSALLGESDPTGRLPCTLPRSSGVAPVRHNDRWSPDRRYRDEPSPVLLPFGHGAERGTVHGELVDAGEHVLLVAQVTAGSRDIEVSLPLYLRRHGGSVLPRQRELAGLRRIRVPAGGTVQVQFELEREAVLAEPCAGTRHTELLLGDLPVGRVEPLDVGNRVAT